MAKSRVTKVRNKKISKRKINKRKYYKKNDRINYPELRVIDDEGENAGVLSTNEALDLAKSKGLDLVVITEGAKPPVARILDFNKFLYEQNKKSSQIKSKSKKIKLKELRVNGQIDRGGLEMKANRAKGFLEEGNKVRFTIVLRGRQKAYPELAREKVEEFCEILQGVAQKEGEIEKKGDSFYVNLQKA